MNQIELLEIKNLLRKTKNETASQGNGTDQMEEQISDIEDRNPEEKQKEKERDLFEIEKKKNERTFQKLCDAIIKIT